MQPLEPAVLVREVDALAGDLVEPLRASDRSVRELVRELPAADLERVWLTGSGDSFHSACAAELAFESLAGIACEPLSTLRCLDYALPTLTASTARRTLVVAASASGATDRVVRTLERARQRGAPTLAITCTPDSPVTRAADRAAVVTLPSREPAPGIRTHQASLMTMLLLALGLAEARGRDVRDPRAELLGMAGPVAATREAIRDACKAVGKSVAAGATPVVAGSGPNYGTALFAAAKLAEAAGVVAVAQDLEEWWHVERHILPADSPLVVLGPPGRARWRAAQIAERAAELGRTVIAVAEPDDHEVVRHARHTVPVPCRVREEFSPLLYDLFAGLVAADVASRLGRSPFEGSRGP